MKKVLLIMAVFLGGSFSVRANNPEADIQALQSRIQQLEQQKSDPRFSRGQGAIQNLINQLQGQIKQLQDTLARQKR